MLVLPLVRLSLSGFILESRSIIPDTIKPFFHSNELYAKYYMPFILKNNL
jgi:hypothetical protein